MASSSETTRNLFERRLQQHERVLRVELSEGLARTTTPSYARFIPREEIVRAVAWVPDSLDAQHVQAGQSAGAEPASASPLADPATLRAARQAQLQTRLADVFAQGRQAGRDEMAVEMHTQTRDALEAFRLQQTDEVGVPVAALLTAFQQGLDGVEQSLARRLAGIAMQMARQVVRSELQTRAALVVDVVQEALVEVLLSARHITVKVHPDDLALIAHGCTDVVEARGARLIADAHIARGGCLVESDLGVVDARLSSRWAGAVAAMGTPMLAEVDQHDTTTTS